MEVVFSVGLVSLFTITAVTQFGSALRSTFRDQIVIALGGGKAEAVAGVPSTGGGGSKSSSRPIGTSPNPVGIRR
jgi:hypothetical protein